MPQVLANGIKLEYQLSGSEGASPMLLISGHNAQLVGWDDEFVAGLASHGFRVITFDNRDVGLSTKLEDGPEPDILACAAGDYSSASYTLADMADDTAGLLDALGIPAAHVMGVSMGGMIAQWFAIKHPDKTLSLTSIMSTTGNREVGMPTPSGLEQLLRPAALTMEESISQELEGYVALASPGYPKEVERVHKRIERQHLRCWHPKGAARQLAAILASGDWTDQLFSVTAPTIVIHGDSDQIISSDGGEATARTIPGADLMIIPGMGHDIPSPLWPAVFQAMEGLARGAEGQK